MDSEDLDSSEPFIASKAPSNLDDATSVLICSNNEGQPVITNGSHHRGSRLEESFTSARASSKSSWNFVPKRYLFSFTGLVACCLSVVFNSNLSIAIVCMVNRNSSLTWSKNSNECLSNAPLQQQSDPEYKPGEFFWTPETEGLAIGAAYYGQLFGFLPGGRMAELYGGKRVLIASLFMASFLTTLLPIAAQWSVNAFVACRFFIGVGTAPAIPVLFYLIGKWIPMTERSFHASVILSGYGIGSFAGFIVGGALCGSNFLNGWPSVFYTGGLAGFLWCISCYFLVHESPLDHPTISPDELQYILKNMPMKQNKQTLKIPWKKMLLSVPFWCLAIGYFGQFWLLGFFNTVHALYMGTIINLDIVKNGQLSSLPHLLRALFACLCSFPADYALRKGYFSLGTIRKGASVLNTVVSCLGFVGILLVGCDPMLNTIFFVVGALLGDFVTFGVCMACVDIAPALSGTVSGVMNIVGVVPFFAIPAIVGSVTKYERTMAQWRYVFYGTLAVAVVSTLIYALFGTSNPQPWATESSLEDEVQNSAQCPKSNSETKGTNSRLQCNGHSEDAKDSIRECQENNSRIPCCEVLDERTNA